MRKKVLNILQYMIFLGGGIFLVWWQLKSMTEVQMEAFIQSFKHARYWLLIPVIVSIILGNISRAMRWKLLMEPLGYKPALKNVFAVIMVGFLANAAIPRLGEILKCTFLARYEKLKVDKLVGTVIVERTFDFICYLFFIFLTVIIQIDLIGDYVKSKMKLYTVSTGMPVWGKLLILIMIIAAFILFIKWLLVRFPGVKFIGKINDFIKGIIAGFASIRKLQHRKEFILHTLFIWGNFMLQIYLGFLAMEGTAHLGIKAGFSVLTLATLAMIATPGGIGSFPIFITETLLIYDIPASQGIAFGWLMWGIFTGIVIILGFISLLLLPYLNKKNSKNEISTTHTVKNF